MSHADKKLIIRRYFEDVWNRGDRAALEEIVSAHAVAHTVKGTLRGRSALEVRLGWLLEAFSSPSFSIEDQIAAGDKVAVRWVFRGVHTGPYQGIEPTGNSVTVSGISIFRLADGVIEELWMNADDLGELQQLGAIPPNW
jgi:predicted ester cyclase